MTKTEKLEWLEKSLMRAVDVIGDITPIVMARYYAEYPDAVASFERHGAGNRAQLEGLMIENAIYCLTQYIEQPSDIQILLSSSVPHHHFMLGVPTSRYQGLVDATIQTILDGIPPEAASERLVLAEIQDGLGALFQDCAADLPTDLTACLA
ncbi:MAG TPA: hypothetical protein VFG34_10610 [Sphingopyxis sp.]|nr:hypothetical protein [Sphingopyxis sp.]